MEFGLCYIFKACNSTVCDFIIMFNNLDFVCNKKMLSIQTFQVEEGSIYVIDTS